MKQVLSVGQCGFDHSGISRFLGQHFDVSISPASTVDQAMERLRNQHYDLVLVNRQFDLDGYEGLDFIRQLKATPEVESVPVMLVTNFGDYAQRAVELGAVAGFGKSELDSPALVDRLKTHLG